MGIKKYKPYTPSRRYISNPDFSELSPAEPLKRLLKPKKSKSGRNNTGRITIRFRGGGHKKKYRIIDFKRNKYDVPGKVETLEYDPNRSAFISRILYADGERRYIIAPEKLRVGDTVISSREKVEVKIGNAMPLKHIPVGSFVHNVEFKIGKGGQIARTAGSQCQVMAKEKGQVLLRIPSGEMRYVNENCMATIGQVGNTDHENVSIGKAGRMRWLGRRPHNRGASMNPCDHPHGGGEGRAGQGNPHPVTPWGTPTKGYKTRKKGKLSDKLIIKRRK